MIRSRAFARIVGCILASAGPLLAASAPVALRAEPPSLHEVHLVRQPGRDDQPLAFSPAVLTVAPGTAVRWVNAADVFHTVTFAQSTAVRMPSGVFEATLARPGETVEFRFDTPGEYAYYCEPHVEFMAGVVHVVASDHPNTRSITRFPKTGMGAPALTAAAGDTSKAAVLLAGAASLAMLLALSLILRSRARRPVRQP